MIDHVVKSYLNDKINCRNERGSQNLEWEIKLRYFKQPLIGLHYKKKKKRVD